MHVLLLVLSLFSVSAQAQETASDTFFTATVTAIVSQERDTAAGFERTVQHLELQLDDGTIEHIEYAVLGESAQTLLAEGDRIVVERVVRIDGSEMLLVREPYRLPAVLLVAAAFFLCAVFFAGRTGFTSILGLIVSILVLALFVVPAIGKGANPLFVSFTGSVAIACTSLYLAHGFRRTTTIALGSTLITLMIALLLSIVAVRITQLFGMGSEETMFLQLGTLHMVNLRGLLLGGIVIGTLGVLDDITTTQTAAIVELKRANPRLSRSQLYTAGLTIGREHIASLVNTLALAYVGASLPLLLLFWNNLGAPWWVILNSESLVEEVVRTLVGSMTLTLAVPISTWVACRYVTGVERSHPHVHAHGITHAHPEAPNHR